MRRVIPVPQGRFLVPAHPPSGLVISARARALGRFLLALSLLFCGTGVFEADPAPPAAIKKPPARSVVLITVEGLRPDYLSCYGKGRGKPTPRIDQLSAESRLFEQVVSPSVSTLPTLATLFTGKTLFEHQVWDDEYRNRLGEKEITLAEQLKAKGYRTGAFLGTSRAAAGRGFDQGFEIYQDGYVRAPTGKWNLALRPSPAVMSGVRSWMEGISGEPFFLWVHFVDPIVPGPGTPEQVATDLEKAYVERLGTLDGQIGALLDLLKQRKDYESLTIVLTADHGFGLGEHGESRAGVFLYEGTLRVPLILRAPASDLAKGTRVAELSGLIDLYPTLARLLGLPPARGLSGRDLLGPAPGASPSYHATALFGRETFGWEGREALSQGKWRLILGKHTELYDLLSDPGETRNLGSSLPDEVSRLRATLQSLRGGASIPAAHFQVGPVPAEPAGKQLKLLGMTPPTLEKALARSLPNPDQFRGSLVLLEEMALRWEVFGNKVFVKIQEPLLKADPQALLTLVGLGAINITAGEEGLKKARDLLRTAQELYPLESEVYHQLGHLALREERKGDAIFFFETSLALRPLYSGEVAYDLACAYALDGDKTKALKQLRESVRLGFRDPQIIGSDPDLESLRSEAGYKKLMEEEFQAP